MKILFIAPRIPYPLDHGNAVATWDLIRYLSGRGHRITFATIVNLEIKPEFLNSIKLHCDLTYVIKNTENSFLGAVLNLFSAIPYTIKRFHSTALVRELFNLINQESFDIIHVDLVQMSFYGRLLKEKYKIPVILRLHNCETVLMKRRYKKERNFFLKLYTFIEWRKMNHYESKMTRFFDLCLPMSKQDQKKLKELNPAIKTSIVPQGVDTSYFYPIGIDEEPCSLISVGSLDWMPNAEGMYWFLEEVLPLLKKVYPETKLYLVGKNQLKTSKRFARDGVITTGFVDDPTKYIARSSVYIVPLRVGSGLRMKILHALAMGKAVVSTSIGCEGIPLTSGKEICIADSPEDFASTILELFENRSRRLEIGQAGLEFVRKEYNWEVVVDSLEKEYQRVIREYNSQF